MRVESLELSWFRGAGESVLLKPREKSVVIYGTNGAGKSSFADAFEYIVSNGKIRHLAHEYSGQHQHLGLRNTHAPENRPAHLRLQFQENTWLTVTIQPDGIFSIDCTPPDLASKVQSWDLERLILRQDEVARFIHATKGEKYSVLLPLLGLEGLENAAVNLRSLQKTLTDRGKIEQKKQRLKDLKQSALSSLPDLTPQTVNGTLALLASSYLPEELRSENSGQQAAISKAIETRVNASEPEQKRYLLLQQIQQEQLQEKLSFLEEAEKMAESVTSAIVDRQIAVLEPTEEFILALEAGLELVECPACGREIAVKEFVAHVEEELLELNRARDARNNVIQARETLKNSITELQKRSTQIDFSGWDDLLDSTKLIEALGLITSLDLNQCNRRWDDLTWETLHREIPVIHNAIDKALKNVPPSMQNLLRDSQISSALGEIPEINELEDEIGGINILIQSLAAAETSIRDTIKARTLTIMDRVSGEVQRLWTKLHPNEPIEQVKLYIPGDVEKAIDICLKFYGVDQPSPRLTLSEGHRNSLGLCIFLALVKLEADNKRPIILDDVVSSLDREHRGMLAKVLLDDFADRQVILLTHDREWYSELRTRFSTKYWDFQVLRPWQNPLNGIQWSESKDTFDDARSLIKINPEAAGNRVRAIMDTQLAIYAERLRIRVPYTRGDRNDRRTCMEFLDHIISEAKDKLRKKEDIVWVKYPAPLNDWNDTFSLLISWANRSSHTGSLVGNEVECLIESCEKTLSHFRCQMCGEPIWFAEQTNKGKLQCSCGEFMWKYD